MLLSLCLYRWVGMYVLVSGGTRHAKLEEHEGSKSKSLAITHVHAMSDEAKASRRVHLMVKKWNKHSSTRPPSSHTSPLP